MTAGLFKPGYEHWRFTSTQNDYGEVVEEWAKLADIEGRAYPKSAGTEALDSSLYGTIVWIFATRPDVDLKVADEIRFGGRRIKVQVVPITSTGRRIEARCSEVQG
jgi:head-tail adaptor